MDARAELEAKINAILPPRYQHCFERVRPTSMGSAAILRDSSGRIAWGMIWTSFCDLALAGGPPHRGTMLAPPSPDDIAADEAGYRRVIDEIGRAVGLMTRFAYSGEVAPGWVGVPCESEQMAAWMRAAIVAENVAARRDGSILWLPAGPAYRDEKEIKNVMVALAKTAHYWDGHLTDGQQSAADVLLDPIDGESGWLAVACEDEEAAAWLLRAVVVGGVLCRREGAVLYVPVGGQAGEVLAAARGLARIPAPSHPTP